MDELMGAETIVDVPFPTPLSQRSISLSKDRWGMTARIS